MCVCGGGGGGVCVHNAAASATVHMRISVSMKKLW